MKLPDGTYKLTRNVKNPERNLRNKHDWTCFDHWEEGDVFFLRTVGSFKDSTNTWQELQLKDKSRTLPDMNDAFALILFACEKVEETPSLYLKRLHCDDEALRLLDYMEQEGVITNRDVQIAIEGMHQRDRGEEDE